MSCRRSDPRTGLLVTLLAAGALAAAAAADADVTIRSPDEAPFELLRPAAGEVLVAGQPAAVAWRADRELSAEGIHEWEAFLSFDGGRTWPVRITPHLDIDRSSFHFVVPPIPSDHVRLMLRFGDERREVGFILPSEWRSVVPAGSPGLAVAPSPAPAIEPGEAARPGVPGVVLWAEGDPDGRGVRLRAAAWTPPNLQPRRSHHFSVSPAVVPTDQRMSDGATDRTPLLETAGLISRTRAQVRASVHILPLLLLVCRRNE